MDELIKQYAEGLRTIYHNRTLGDHTFEEVLAEFLEDATDDCEKIQRLTRRHNDWHHRN